jgi:hypothetical protein
LAGWLVYGNEAFVFVLPKIGLISVTKTLQKCPSERVVSFIILSVIDMKRMYVLETSALVRPLQAPIKHVYIATSLPMGYAVVQLVEALHFKPEGRGFGRVTGILH